MERNRRAGAASGGGVVMATRRQRGRNPADEEDKMEETSELRLGKRPKKDMHGLSASGNSLNKRKRWGMGQDTQPFGSHEALEEVKAEDEDELSAPPHLQRHVKSRVQSKEDRFFLDFSVVPRKQRSSISSRSRVTSTVKKQQDLCFTQQQSPVTTLNGTSSPYGSFARNRKKRLRPSGTELHTMKVSQMSDFSAVSDQEAEVAEALFVLASSRPSHVGVKLGTEAKCASFTATTQHVVVVPSSLGPEFASEGPKGKQPGVDAEKKEGKSPIVGVVYSASSPSELVHSSVGETELESALPRAHSLVGEANSFRSETSNSKIPAGSPHCVPCWPRHNKETMPRGLEEHCKDYNGVKKVRQETLINADMEEKQHEVCIANRTSTATQNQSVDGLGNHDKALVKSSRSDSSHDYDGCISMSKIDFMAPSTIQTSEGVHENGGELSSHVLAKEDSVKVLNTGNGYLKLKGRMDGGIQGSNQKFEEQKEQTSETVRRPQDGEVKEEEHFSKASPYRKVNDTGNSSVSSCFSSLSSTAVSRRVPMGLAGWTSGFSQLGYHDSAATSSLSLDMKSAMQLPHAAISLPVPKMKSCATHVYVAHYIHREQLVTRHSLWSAALCRATTLNLNIPPVKPLANERARQGYTGFSQKAQTHQSSMQRTANSGSTHGSSAAGSISASNLPTSSRASSETSMVTAPGHAMAAHAQYLQAMMRQTGVTSFPHLVNGPPGQPHLIPHLQPLTQQAANMPPVQMQHQAKGASSSPLEQQKALQSSSQSQRWAQNLVETSASESSGHLETQSKDLSLMAPSGGYIGKSQQTSASSSSGQQQYLKSQNTVSSTGYQVKGLDQSFSSTPAVIGVSKEPVGPGPLGLVSSASITPIEGPGVQPQPSKRGESTSCEANTRGVQPESYKRGQNQSTSSEAACIQDDAFTMKEQDYIEDRKVKMKQGEALFDLPKANVKFSSVPSLTSSVNADDPLVNDAELILRSVSVSGTQSCESASSFVREHASQQISSLLEAKMQMHHAFSSTFGAPSTPPKVLSSAAAASDNVSEALSVQSSPPSVSKGAPSSALERPSDRKGPLLQALPSHLVRVEAQENQQAGQAQQCLDLDARNSHTQQKKCQDMSSPILAANDGLHSSSLHLSSGATILDTPTDLKYSKPLLDVGIQQGPAIFSSIPSQTTVASS